MPDFFTITDDKPNQPGQRYAAIRHDATHNVLAVSEAAARDLVAKLTAWLDAPRLASLAAAEADRTARGVTIYRAPQPYSVDSVIDQVTCDIYDAHDEAGHLAEPIGAAMQAQCDRLEALMAEAWERIVDELGLTVEVEAAPLDKLAVKP